MFVIRSPSFQGVRKLADISLRDRRPHGRGRRAYRDVFKACSASLCQL